MVADRAPRFGMTFVLPPVGVGVQFPIDYRNWFRKGPPDAATCIHRWVKGADTVVLRISCYTLQTTMETLFRVFTRLEEGPRPRRAQVRVLRPDLSKPLAIWDVSDRRQRNYWDAVRASAEKSEAVRGLFTEMFPYVEFAERLFPFDPCIRSIIVNDKAALFGLYAAQTHTKKGRPGLVALDYVGPITRLSAIEKRNSTGEMVLGELMRWFRRTWRTCP